MRFPVDSTSDSTNVSKPRKLENIINSARASRKTGAENIGTLPNINPPINLSQLMVAKSDPGLFEQMDRLAKTKNIEDFKAILTSICSKIDSGSLRVLLDTYKNKFYANNDVYLQTFVECLIDCCKNNTDFFKEMVPLAVSDDRIIRELAGDVVYYANSSIDDTQLKSAEVNFFIEKMDSLSEEAKTDVYRCLGSTDIQMGVAITQKLLDKELPKEKKEILSQILSESIGEILQYDKEEHLFPGYYFMQSVASFFDDKNKKVSLTWYHLTIYALMANSKNMTVRTSLSYVLGAAINDLHELKRDDLIGDIGRSLSDRELYDIVALSGPSLYAVTFNRFFPEIERRIKSVGLSKFLDRVDPQREDLIDFVSTLSFHRKTDPMLSMLRDNPGEMDRVWAYLNHCEYGDDKTYLFYAANLTVFLATLFDPANDGRYISLQKKVQNDIISNYDKSPENSIHKKIYAFYMNEFPGDGKKAPEIASFEDPGLPMSWGDKINVRVDFWTEAKMDHESFVEQLKQNGYNVSGGNIFSKSFPSGKTISIEVLYHEKSPEKPDEMRELFKSDKYQIRVSRSHGYETEYTFPLEEDQLYPQEQLIFFGGCVGFRDVPSYKQILLNSQFISNYSTGIGSRNNACLLSFLDAVGSGLKKYSQIKNYLKEKKVDVQAYNFPCDKSQVLVDYLTKEYFYPSIPVSSPANLPPQANNSKKPGRPIKILLTSFKPYDIYEENKSFKINGSEIIAQRINQAADEIKKSCGLGKNDVEIEWLDLSVEWNIDKVLSDKIRTFSPDLILSMGGDPQTQYALIENRAYNYKTKVFDANHFLPGSELIDPSGPENRDLSVPADLFYGLDPDLFRLHRSAKNDASMCNLAFYRALENAEKKNDSIAYFIHIPNLPGDSDKMKSIEQNLIQLLRSSINKVLHSVTLSQ